MKKTLKFLKRAIVIILLLIIGTGVGATVFFYPKVKTLYIEASDKVNNIKENTFKSAQTSLVYDSDQNLIAKLKGEKDVYYLPFDKIPDNFKYAFIATEDKNFLNHKGIDFKGIGRAFVNLIKNREISGGGSTITQQLARNVFLTHETSFERKIKEIFISILLEKRYSKEEILEFYINSIYFANGVYGIEAASKKYFSKPSSELSLSETAFIAAIPNNPSLYDPLRKFENTLKRRNRMLGYMLEDGYITQEEHDKAIKEEIVLNVEKNNKNNYVDTYVIDAATEKLMELKGFEFKSNFRNERDRKLYNDSYNELYSQCQKELYTGGYRIYTSIDMKKQKILQDAVDKNLANFKEKSENGMYSFQGAATSIDNTTGKVVAIVGGRSQETSGYTLNRAFQSFRQPGSTFKPIAVYAPAIEKGYLPSSIVNDVKDADGPRNYNGKYEGPITLRYAVEQSKNTVAWNVFNDIGPKTGLSYIRNMGFEKIVEEDNTLSSALGGLTYGASTLEMASAYSSLARDGYFYKPTCITKITDASGSVIYNDSAEPIQIYTQKSARVMTDMLQSVMTNGTGRRLILNNMPSAGKTGSTNDNKDGWFAGYTPYYTTVVWCGFDTPKKLSNLYGSTYPGYIWKEYMNSIHKDLPYKEFSKYEGLQQEEAALTEQIKAEEEKKVLIDEIDSSLELYMNKEINSLSDVEALEALESEILSKIDRLKDEDKKNSYFTIMENRRNEISSKKEWFLSQSTPPPTDNNEGDSGNTEEIVPPSNDGGTEDSTEQNNSDNENSIESNQAG